MIIHHIHSPAIKNKHINLPSLVNALNLVELILATRRSAMFNRIRVEHYEWSSAANAIKLKDNIGPGVHVAYSLIRHEVEDYATKSKVREHLNYFKERLPFYYKEDMMELPAMQTVAKAYWIYLMRGNIAKTMETEGLLQERLQELGEEIKRIESLPLYTKGYKDDKPYLHNETIQSLRRSFYHSHMVAPYHYLCEEIDRVINMGHRKHMDDSLTKLVMPKSVSVEYQVTNDNGKLKVTGSKLVPTE